MSIGLRGWTWALPEILFGPLPRRNPGLGAGAFVYGFACLTLLSQACARLGAFRGDAFAAGLLAWVLAILGLFVAYPLVKLGVSAFQSPRGAFAPEMFWPRVSDIRIWRADGPLRTTILLGFASATSSTVLALAFGLMTERTQTPGRRLLRMLSILPIITPPFVLGLSVILLFGRNGAVNRLLEIAFGIEPTRWIYGFQGVWFAQTLAFTPIAYLVLVSVLKGMNPALEEAAQTLRGSARLRLAHRHRAARSARARECLPRRLRAKPRRLRQSASSRRRHAGAVDRDLLRGRRRARRIAASRRSWP